VVAKRGKVGNGKLRLGREKNPQETLQVASTMTVPRCRAYHEFCIIASISEVFGAPHPLCNISYKI